MLHCVYNKSSNEIFSQEVRRENFHDFLASRIGQSKTRKSRSTVEPTHSLNRTLISKETFKKQHLPQFELKSLTNHSRVGEMAAYLSSGYLGIQYCSTTPSDQRF